MNLEWQCFLDQAGATINEDGLPQFERQVDVSEDSALCALAGDVVLRVTGDDAETFLQGQFSNDIAALENGVGTQLSTWSSPKGRVLAVFRVVQLEKNHYLIKLPAELVDGIVKRLRMFVLRAKVTIEVDSGLVCLGVSGVEGSAVLENFVGNLPTGIDEYTDSNGAIAVRVSGGIPRFEIAASIDQAKQLWTQLADKCQQSGDRPWRLQNIDAGVPSIGSATTEAFVLQMLNVQHINGVSFKKGCFPGQEVVARMQYLGKLKRRMYRARLQSATVPLPGDELFNEGVNSAVGKIVDAQRDLGNEVRLLAVVSIEAASKPLYTDKEATQALELLDLPYSLES